MIVERASTVGVSVGNRVSSDHRTCALSAGVAAVALTLAACGAATTEPPAPWSKAAGGIDDVPVARPGDQSSSNLVVAGRYTGMAQGGAFDENGLDIVSVDVRTRAAIGRGFLRLCAGLDGTIGASNTGLAYGAGLYPIGIVMHLMTIGRQMWWGSACAGVGISGVRGSIPFGWEFPGEIALEGDLGPVRLRVWGRPAWIADADARRDGTFDAAAAGPDEFSSGIEVRVDRRTRTWGEAFAGGGPVLGFAIFDVMGSTFTGIYAGFAFSRTDPTIPLVGD